jgi:hypothetical protein
MELEAVIQLKPRSYKFNYKGQVQPERTGLNRPATVTMYEITPNENESEADFIAFLKDNIHVTGDGQRFISYNITAGTFIFSIHS